MNNLEKVSHETIWYLVRENTGLMEIGDGRDELKFKQGRKLSLPSIQ